MKKIMFILAFVGIGLFASASNGKFGKGKSTFKNIAKTTKKQKLVVNEWKYIVNCPNGTHHEGCCYPSYNVAIGMAHYVYAGVCGGGSN